MKRIFHILPVILLIVTGCRISDNQAHDALEIAEKAGLTPTEDIYSLKSTVDTKPFDAYFLARKAYDAELFKTAEKILNSNYEKSTSLIGEKISEFFCDIYMKQRRYNDVVSFSGVAASEYPKNYYYQRRSADALFHQKKYKELLILIDTLKGFALYKNDSELFFLETVAQYNLYNVNKLQAWKDFFINCPANDSFLKGWDFLAKKESLNFNDFSEIGKIIEAKYYLADKQYNKSAKAFFEALSDISPEYLTGSVIYDCEISFLRSGNSLKGGRVLQELSEKTGNFNCLFTAARLFRSYGYYKDSEKCLNEIKNNFQEQITERVLWYMLDIQIKRQAVEAVNQLDYYINRWNRPRYFEDILDNLCTELVQGENWAEIKELAKKLENTGLTEILDRCRFILKEAADSGFYQYQDEIYQNKSDYYSFLSGENPYEDILKDSSEIDFSNKKMNEYETYIYKMIEYDIDGLVEEITSLNTHLSEWFCIFCADTLAEKGEYLNSIKVMYQYRGELSAEGLKRLYPNVYSELIKKHSKQNNIPPQLFTAIVWKESAFDSDIVSFSGAVGLSQLMPATAEDVAQRMDVKVEDLTDPNENITYGSWYLSWLESYVGNTALAVISYNGGPGRVKRWQKEFPNFSDKLFYEAVPIKETHLYGKRVLTAAILYGMLYYDKKPSETIKLFF